MSPLLRLLILLFVFVAPLTAQNFPPPGPFGGKINAIVSNGDALFAGTETGDVYVTTKTGNTWYRTGINRTKTKVQLLEIDDKGNVVFAPTTDISNNHLEILSLTANGKTVYAGTRNGGIYHTTDGYSSWKQIIPPREVIGKNITALRMIGKELFVGTDIEGLLVLQGDKLLPRNDGLTSTSIEHIMADGNTVYVATGDGPARSTNGGKTWEMILNNLPELNWGHTVLSAGGTLFTAGSKGVFTSTNGGDSWNGFIQAELGEGYCELWQSGGLLIAELRESGAWISANAGMTWKRMPNAPADILDITTHNGSLVAAATTGIYHSNDQGQTWQAWMNGVTATAVNDLVELGEMVFAATDNGVYATPKGDTRWQRLPAGPERWVRSLGKHNGAVYAGMSYGGIQRTTDNGASWIPLSGGFPEDKQVSQLVSDRQKCYAVTWGGLFVTTNDGESWENIPVGDRADGVMTALLANGDTLWAGVSGEGIFNSTDAGASWQQVTKGLPEGADINQLAWQGKTLYAVVRTFPSFGRFTDRLYSYIASSKSWRATPGIPPKGAEITALISAANQLVVATNQGLYSSSIPGKPFKLVKPDIVSARCGISVGNSIWFGTSWSGVWGMQF